MQTTTITAQTFNQNPSAAKRAAMDGPVVITERGRDALVLMTYEMFASFVEGARPKRKLIEIADTSPEGDVDFIIERANVGRKIEW